MTSGIRAASPGCARERGSQLRATWLAARDLQLAARANDSQRAARDAARSIRRVPRGPQVQKNFMIGTEGRTSSKELYYDDEEQAALAYNAYVRRHGLGNPLNDVDANGKLVPTIIKRTSRFWGVSWYPPTSQWKVQYRDDSKPRSKHCYVGYFADEERAALAYNEAVIAADLDHIRKMNRVDPATGRPLPKDQD